MSDLKNVLENVNKVKHFLDVILLRFSNSNTKSMLSLNSTSTSRWFFLHRFACPNQYHGSLIKLQSMKSIDEIEEQAEDGFGIEVLAYNHKPLLRDSGLKM